MAYYATPGEVITKLTLLSGALMSVLFPAIATSYHSDRPHSARLLERGLTYVLIVVFPIVLLLVAFAPEGLQLWLGESFKLRSTRVAQFLAGGIFFACLGQIPYAFIQGAGRPDLTGKLHLCELPPYLLLLYIAIHYGGIVAAAAVWAARMVVDAACLYVIAQRMLAQDRLHMPLMFVTLSTAVVMLIVIGGVLSLPARIVGCLLILMLFTWFALRHLLSANEKAAVVAVFQSDGTKLSS